MELGFKQISASSSWNNQLVPEHHSALDLYLSLYGQVFLQIKGKWNREIAGFYKKN